MGNPFRYFNSSPEIIQHAVWLYARFTLWFHDVEDLLAERDIDVSNETVRRWFLKFRRLISGNLRWRRSRASARRHLNPRKIFEQNLAAALAEWRQLAA